MSNVGAALSRVAGLHPKLIDLALDRMHRLLEKLGHPERRLPPVIHVGGTNGKGSTCAFLRAVAEADGQRVHVYTSPHLVHVEERIRIGGTLVEPSIFAAALAETEDLNARSPITEFELLTATALLLFARHPADLCILEVGLGGRFDASNVCDRPAAAAITAISLDHQEFLGDSLRAIAAEKAGIMKAGAPVATGFQHPAVLDVLVAEARQRGAALLRRGVEWTVTQTGSGLVYEDAEGRLVLPRPRLLGDHQIDNAGIAVAALRAAGLGLPDAAYAGIAAADWPARLQRLTGKLAARLPPGFELWLDGGHNEGAAIALADHLASWSDRPLYVIIGMKQTKNAAAFLRPLLSLATRIYAVAEADQTGAMPVADIVNASGGLALPASGIDAALADIFQAPAGRILICGSLYLAGAVLAREEAVLS